MTDGSLTRRRLLQTAAGASAAAVAAGPALAQSSGPDYGGWFDNVGNFDGTVDKTGQDSVTITVGAEGNGGAFAFGPAAVRVSPGTRVVWKWTGNGGSHNVVADGGAFESELVGEAGHTFEQTLDEEGIYKYFCSPHKAMGMKGAVVVGSAGGATPTTTESGGSGGGDSSPDYGSWFDNVGNFDGTVDETGADRVTVNVGAEGNGGAFAFAPAAVEVSTGTTVVWEWTGNGGSHNVVAEDGTFESELVGEGGHTFEYTFEEPGVYKYACSPHKSMGMKGAIVVSEASGGESTAAAADGGSAGEPTALQLTPTSGAVGLSMLLAFLSPLGLAAYLRRKNGDESGSPGQPRSGD